jgi:hypothetical protein
VAAKNGRKVKKTVGKLKTSIFSGVLDLPQNLAPQTLIGGQHRHKIMTELTRLHHIYRRPRPTLHKNTDTVRSSIFSRRKL